MKTQILRLDPHDDIISARDKMGWSQTGRILLVWPDRGQVLARRIDLTLIQRHSQKLGAQLALVTHDSNVIYYADLLGIPVYKSIQQAQKIHWRVERRRKRSNQSALDQSRPRPDRETLRQDARPPTSELVTQSGVRLWAFTLGVIALLAIAAVLYPQADIHLKAATQTQEAIIDIRSGSDILKVAISGAIPAHWTKVIVEGRDSTLTQGSIRLPQEYATGQIALTNLTESLITVPADTMIRTLDDPPVRFATTREGVVPAGVGKILTLPIKAVAPGSSGNLPAGSLIAIEGQPGANLNANNRSSTHGGSDQAMAVATQHNRDSLYKSLEASLRQTAIEELQSDLPEGNLLFTSTITISEVLEARYDPAENIPSDQVSLNLRIEYQALQVAREDLYQLAASTLDAGLPLGYVPANDNLQTSNISYPVLNSENVARWKLRASRLIKSELAAAQAINMVLGQPPSTASRRLAASLPLAEKPNIDIHPSWWPRLPILPFRIHISSD